MPSCLFNNGVAINIRQKTETETLGVTWIRKTVDCYAWL